MTGPVKIEAVTDLDRLESLRPVWTGLSSHLETDLDFFRRVIAFRPSFISPCILLASLDAAPIALLVGRLEKAVLRPKLGYATLPGLPVNRLVFACHGSQALTSPVADAFTGIIVSRLASGEADVCLLSNLVPTSTLYESARRLPGMFMKNFSRKKIPRRRLHLPQSYEAFLMSLNRKKRYKFRHYIKQFENAFQGTISCRVFSEPQEVDQFCAAAESVASKSYQRRLGVGYLPDEETHRLIATAADMGWLRAIVLYVNNQPVSFWHGNVYKNVFYCDLTAFNPAFGKYAAGIVLLLKNIEGLCGQHVQTIEFGIGNAQFKEEFCNDYAEEAEVNIYAPTLRGFAADGLTTLNFCVNESLIAILKRLGLLNKIKSGWCKRLENTLADHGGG
jgi:hypothetical protein